jgi:ABC-type multidrug transport system fused ATPase/permease subunit
MQRWFVVPLTGEAGKAALARLWLLGLCAVVLQLVMPAQVGRLTDLFQGGAARAPTWTQINTALACLLAAQVAIALLTYWQRKSLARFEQSVTGSLAVEIFARLLRFSADFYRVHKVESINTRVLEDSRVVALFWADAVIVVPLAAVSLVVFGAYMISRNWFLGACLIPLSLLSGYFLFFDRLLQRLNRQVRETWDEVRVRSGEIISGVAEIRNHGAFEHGAGVFQRSFGGYTELMNNVGRWNAFFRAAGPLVGAVQTGTLYWLGAGLCLGGSRLAGFAGQITWGDVVSFLLVAGLFREPVQNIAAFLLDWRMGRENLRRVAEYRQQPLAFADRADAPAVDERQTELVFDRVDVVAEGGTRILHGLDARLPPGRHVALVGPAGCGKSTAMQLVVRGATPSAGRLLLGSRSVADYDVFSLAGRVGFVPQSPVLFDTTLRQNLLLGLRRRGTVCLEDDQGPLDVTHLSDVRSWADVDRRLLEVVRLVGFDEDLLAKSLDNRLPAGPRFDEVRTRIGDLRGLVAARTATLAENTFASFDAGRLLPSGSIRENLFGPGLCTAEAADAECQQLLKSAAGTPLLAELLDLGYRHYVADESLAARLAQKAPRLAELLKARKAGHHISRRPQDLARDGLARLSAHSRRALLGVALDMDMDAAGRLLDAPQLERLLLAARRHLGASCPPRSPQSGRWPTPDAPHYWEDLTLRENLLAGRVDSHRYRAAESVDAAIREALAGGHLLDLILAAGLEFRVGENGKFLSGGQRQKIALGRVLMKNPSILLLDEATASLDEISQARIVEMLRREFQGKTVVAISHRFSTIIDYDEILVLDRGQLVERGAPARLAAMPGLFRELASQDDSAARPPAARGSAAQGDSAPPRVAVDASGANDVRHAIARSALFGRLDADRLMAIERTSTILDCPAGVTLFHRGDPGEELYLICAGEVDFLGPPGQDDASSGGDVVDTLGPGQIFGELALLGDVPRSLSARTKTDVRLLVMSRAQLVELIHADPEIAVALLNTLSRRIAALRDEKYSSAPSPACRSGRTGRGPG